MKIVITIDDKLYERIKYLEPKSDTILDRLMKSVKNGTPLPKGHGRLIDANALEYTCNSDECGMLTGCNHCQYHIITEDEIDDAPTIIKAESKVEE